ncbi:GntR family transcriptional regulator [Achromobacter sp. GG226]|uniref:GntR family transcriptional regulator n=1 Tax=Verticiella alkaliphila TaxID=2779529 RepID=UPI001C0B98F4|nr:GntR family transcriptional regulator [Verticiella sp. GG226]MBU4609416.1 GntR family transcriptional regulator [Verticiella sp. GG226]
MADSPESIDIRLESPLFARVRDALRTAILRGELPPGAKLPSEAQLSAQHGVSRITVRQALAELQASGLVRTVNGRGSFVSQPGAPGGQSPLVGVLESMRKRGFRAHGRLVSQRTVPANAEVAKALGLIAGTPVGALTVMRYRDDAPFAIGTTYLDPPLAERLATQDLVEHDVNDVLHRVLGLRTAKTRVTVQAVATEPGLARRLRREAGTPLLRILTTSFDYDRVPVVYSETFGAPEVMEYRATLHGWPEEDA